MVHQMGVSANLITKDDYLLLGKRGNNQIDKQLLYPSANGNAEVISDKVEFYLNSARADLPTINENNPFRMDFNGELSRDVEAELSVLVSEEAWKIQGIAISRTSKPEITKRRMHFNVIMISKIDESFTDIEEKQKNSLESEETESMTGIKIHFYKNRFALIKQPFLNIIESIYSIISLVCLIALIINFKQNNGILEYIENIFLLFLSIVSLYNSIIHLKEKIQLRKKPVLCIVKIIISKKTLLKSFIKRCIQKIWISPCYISCN